jgi:hypothetical protein
MVNSVGDSPEHIAAAQRLTRKKYNAGRKTNENKSSLNSFARRYALA